MTYSSKEHKTAGKNDLNGKWGLAIAAALLAIFVPSMVLSVPEGILSGMSSVMMEYGDAETGFLLSQIGMVFTAVFSIFILGPLSIGYYAFTLRLSRGAEVTATMPYRVFTKGFYGRFTLAFFMMNLFVFLW
ncbi:MAG: hypothetical protein IIY02_01300, partial [Firmicutes bacterium]|nr:hypothetical protein [Bacillota bacterium]